MKKNSMLITAFLVVFALGVNTATAQITITIPKFPKIKKPKVEPPTTTNGDNQTVQAQPSEQKTSSLTSDDETSNPIFKLDLDEIAGTIKDVDSFTPGGKTGLVSYVIYEHWLLRAVSMRAREEWIKDRWKTPNGRKKFAAALDALAVSAAKKLPIHIEEPKRYTVQNLAEEKTMKTVMGNLAALKIHKIGLKEANWLISKNEFGLPTQRYKRGIIWARNSADDHPYCNFYHVNIVQDYAGGGTYGASFASFRGHELAGCPAGK